MLSIKALEAAIPLTQRLDAADRVLTVVPNTPLAALVNSTFVANGAYMGNQVTATTHGSTAPMNDSDGEYRPDLFTIVYMTNAKDDVISECAHDTAMDEITEVATQAVVGHINVARTLVAPAVLELTERTAAKIAGLTASSIANKEVIVSEYPAPLANNSLEQLTSKWANTAIEDPELQLRLPYQSPEQIADLLKTGIASLDGDVAAWAGGKGDEFFAAIWSTFFHDSGTTPRMFSDKSFRSIISDRDIGTDAALAVFLLANKLFDDGPLEGTEMALEKYNDLTSRFRNQAAGQLERITESYARALKIGSMILKRDDRSITVSGPVYRKWLSEGGSNEILLGLLVDGGMDSLAVDITSKAAEYERKWSNFSAYTMAAENNNRYVSMKEALSNEFRAQLMEVALDEGLDPMTAKANRDNLVDSFNEELEHVKLGEFDNLYELCLKLLCRTRFVNTDAEALLSNIEIICRDNPKLSAREAATVAEAQYIINWVREQFTVAPL